MPVGPSPAHAEDPRLEQVLEDACKKVGLHPTFRQPVRKLVVGEADPRSFQCCNSGCMPCVKDYLKAAEKALLTLGPVASRKRRWWLLWLA